MNLCFSSIQNIVNSSESALSEKRLKRFKEILEKEQSKDEKSDLERFLCIEQWKEMIKRKMKEAYKVTRDSEQKKNRNQFFTVSSKTRIK